MTERVFNSKCSPEETAKEWDSFPSAIVEMISPYRCDEVGFPAIRMKIGDETSPIIRMKIGDEVIQIDAGLLVQCSDGNCGKALQFIKAEIVATVEQILKAA